MRSQLRIVLVTLLIGASWVWGGRISRAVAGMDAFRVRDVEIVGLDAVERAEILELLDVTFQSSVWTDTEEWAERVGAHPLLREARVTRRLPGTLVVTVVERRPVALVPTPTLEPVDAEGRWLPLDPARRRLDLPVLETDARLAEGARLLPARVRQLATEVDRLRQADTTFLQMVSGVAWIDSTTIVARWSEPRVDLLLVPGTSPSRLREGLSVLAHVLDRVIECSPAAIDLRYADQVVVRCHR
jgi:cell division septal protein FtsQ